MRCERRVENHTCVQCPNGTYNPNNDDASGPDTYCNLNIICDENEYAYINDDTNTKECRACPPGTYNAPEDSLSSESSTTCDAIICDVGYGVENHTCVQCGVNTYNPDRFDASGGDRGCITFIRTR